MKICLRYWWLACLAYLACYPHANAQVQPEGARKDTVTKLKIPAKKDIETTVKYYAEDSVVTDAITKEMFLYGKARIEYGDITLEAEYITFDQEKNTLFATGKYDSLGRFRGVAKFKQGEDAYEADTMRYNFKTQKAIVKGIVTKQQEGFITSERSKKTETGEMYALNSHYTTCNKKHPHWYINASRLKMVPNKHVVCGPFNLVIADIPTPFGFLFGMFPLNEKQKSGVVIPTYGEDAQRGFFLRNGGYYWAINDYMAADILGGIYTNGSWELTPTFNYLKRYRFSGNIAISLNRRIGGDDITPTKAMDFSFRWSHTPQPRGRSSFSANVSLTSNNFNQRNNTFNQQQQLSNSTNSGVNYSTSFDIGKSQASLALSVTQDQNTGTGVLNLQLPSLNFSINRIYLFRKDGRRVPEWLKNMNISYSMTAGANFTNDYLQRSQGFGFKVSNAPKNPTDLVVIENPFQNQSTASPVPAFNLKNLPEILRNAQIGAIHNIPLSTSIKLMRHINLSPSLSYREAWFPYKLDYAWEEGKKGVRVDTSQGFHRAYSYSAAVGVNTQIFGIFRFGKKSRIEAIRHTLSPSISASFAPNQDGDRLGFFRTLQVDSTGKMRTVSRFQGFSPAAPIGLAESGSIGFQLNNIFEAKMRPKLDTGEVKKVKLLDNLSMGTSYNIFAESFQLSPINLSARTNIAQLFDINFSSIFDPYLYEPLWIDENYQVRTQERKSVFRWERAGYNWLQMSNASLNFSFNLTPEKFKKQTQQKIAQAGKNLEQNKNKAQGLDAERSKQELQYMKNNPNEYIDFDIPWTLAVNYTLTYSKAGYMASTTQQVMSFSGDLSLTKSWKLSFQSGYDITQNAFTMTNLNFHKDLHCWEAVFSLSPFGQFQQYSFDLKVKASMLQDLKVSKRRFWSDRDIFTR